ncbi:uncharacterized protein LOC106874628 isoform X1 [Octopus bimaculoides]|uniref:uncharacterized protein LOC106874628 isoform X1 n=1 Tax=Octopus bimaculoides TaxID=37653 RepID=UPI00071C46B7|nr:uncharacterized protein LOC106874628 isoform X1 [Octopus bimaculoides]|eukprot:XP_014777909.1 PREDICTED: uncharacterized protein LOC106874628 isoform X1 [Octopus bimaculoides]
MLMAISDGCKYWIIDNQHTILNPNCRMLIFTEWLKMKCKYDKTLEIDLMDFSGNILNLSSSQRWYANEVINVGETYVLLSVERDNGNIKYISLLENLEKIHPELYNKLEGLSGSSKSPARSVSGKSRKSGKNSKLKSSPSPNINQR